MNRSNALRNPAISHETVQGLIAMRESLAAMKKRAQLLKDSVKATEQEIVSMLESGLEVAAGLDLHIRQTERRFPSWKAHFAEVAGAGATERVLRETEPTIYKMLVIK